MCALLTINATQINTPLGAKGGLSIFSSVNTHLCCADQLIRLRRKIEEITYAAEYSKVNTFSKGVLKNGEKLTI